MLGEKLSDVGLSPTTIRDVAKVMRWVKASAVDENGDQYYPTKWNYEFADRPVVENQHTPMFTGEEITKIIAKADKQERVIYVLFTASGLRAGELFGLEVKQFNGDTITVAQSLQGPNEDANISLWFAMFVRIVAARNSIVVYL